ncbi:MAG: hypothetical protein QMD09_12270, partial [Desulfatibacillaceae bacterium]|nr:hypothetical protein [Desulfatibacillaceae bacterium]
DGIEREMIRKCLDLGDDDSPDGLESWLTEITYNLASELLPLDYLSHKNIEKDIYKLLDPLFARRHEHLSLFAKTASKIVADNKLKTSRNPLGKSFVKKAKQAFKNEPANGEKDPLDNLPNPFVDGWQTVVARLKEARKYKSQEGLLSLEEIRQQFARKEIFELIYNNRNSIYELHKKAPENCRKSDEELDDVFKRIEEFAGLERIAPVPGQALFDERLHWPADEISNKLIAPNQITSVDQIGYRLKSTGEVLGKAKVVVNRRSS